ncbi:MAG TPA: VOC family protein [Dehalococcoidia bacterium]|nr:VOC family protein [Dehalococcoidia bacterium]
MRVQSLGHVVLKVRDLERAEEFYHGVLGLPIATRWEDRQMTFFTLGNHHDVAVRALGPDAPLADPAGAGLAHVAFCVGDSLDELRAWKRRLEESGVPIDRITDHKVSHSIYLSDPDGNGIELYVDASDAWKQDPSLVATVEPLKL